MSSSEFDQVIRKTPTTPQLTPTLSKSISRNNFPHELYRQTSSPGNASRRSYKSLAVQKTRRRVVFKNGDCNVVQYRTSKHRLRYLQDIFTTLVDSQWRWTISIFSIVFFGSWFAFALIWWLIALTHGDLEEEHLPKNQKANNWTPCVTAIESFTSAFLFSFETQHTTGYGVKVMTDECPEAIFIMCVQSILGLIIQAFMVGIVFAKMTRPKLRKQTLRFSKSAVVCQRDGSLCLMFRVADIRKSHIIGASISARLVHSKQTKEGDVMQYFQTELPLIADNCEGDLFLIWPMTLVHKIDENSPLYYLSASDLWNEKFEIVVILEGTNESTGQATQAKSSYLTPEILWGYKYEDMIEYNKETQAYEVDYSKFDNTLPVETPLCSAAEVAGYFCENHKIATPGSGNSSPS